MALNASNPTLLPSGTLAAPVLFHEFSVPMRASLIALVADGNYTRTGARRLDSYAKALQTLASEKNRATTNMNVAASSNRAARVALVAWGHLNPYKQRLVAIFEDIVAGVSAYVDWLARGLLPLGRIPVGVGIIVHKRGLALIEPSLVEVGVTAPLDRQALAAESLNSWVSSFPIDMASDVLAPIPPQKPGTIAVDAVLDATLPLRHGKAATTQSRPTALPPRWCSVPSRQGGGGVRP